MAPDWIQLGTLALLGIVYGEVRGVRSLVSGTREDVAFLKGVRAGESKQSGGTE